MTLVNRGRDGARFAEFVGQLRAGERFDAIVVVGGGNDVICLTARDALQEAVRNTARLRFTEVGFAGNGRADHPSS
ncbi:hypothetical protein [Variovorax sp. LjRoot178]|uniref:hypothetical protein n=1 Tax=Variovorax sp. LjRoot178 TaxID=3342277 RepID=UPI003ED09A1E